MKKHIRKAAGAIALFSRRVRHSTLAGLRFIWEATDNEDRVVFAGLILLASGIAHFSRAAALITVGALLILAVRPLRKWFF